MARTGSSCGPSRNAPSGQARRVALDGSLPDPGDIALGLNASSVATDGSGWMVSGADLTGTTFVTRLDGSGAIALPATTVFGSGFEHRLGHDGSTWVMAYERGNQVFVTRLTAAGVSLDGNGVRLDSTALAHDEPVMACRVGECLVGYREGTSNVRVKVARVQGITRLDPTGIVVDPMADSGGVVASGWA